MGDVWPSGIRLGVQFNVCIDEFRADNGATQFVLGSHTRGHAPPKDLNDVRTVMGVGPHKDAVQIEAPAGSAIL